MRFHHIGHCERDTKSLEQPLEVVERKTAQSVTVGHHNFFDSSSERELQNGTQLRPLEVDPTPNVRVHLVLGLSGVHELNLSLQITRVLLLPG